MTPEGRIKAAVKVLLKSFAPYVYYHMPVQNGMGSPCLDFNGCAFGLRFDIETKAPGKKPTPRQAGTIKQIRAAGGKVFVIDGDLTELEAWVHMLYPPHTVQSPPPPSTTTSWLGMDRKHFATKNS